MAPLEELGRGCYNQWWDVQGEAEAESLELGGIAGPAISPNTVEQMKGREYAPSSQLMASGQQSWLGPRTPSHPAPIKLRLKQSMRTNSVPVALD